MTKDLLFFDNASTTPCCAEAADLVKRFAQVAYGNPSSSHQLGQESKKAIDSARSTFGQIFKVSPKNVIFTASGSEADNLAIYGVAMAYLARQNQARQAGVPVATAAKLPEKLPRIITSPIEHPAVKKTCESLKDIGFDVQMVRVTPQAQIDRAHFESLLTPETVLVSIQRVNNIVGAIMPVEELARTVKDRVPGAVFHTDAVQAFGRVDVPVSGSAVDTVAISGHKVGGPKGVGALIVLNDQLLINKGIRPLVWGGEQEGGLRSGTQNAGLIAGFEWAAKNTLAKRTQYLEKVSALREAFAAKVSSDQQVSAKLEWNTPRDLTSAFVPQIVSLSIPGLPGAMIAAELEKRGFLVSTGSACSSAKMEPDPVLSAMGVSLPARLGAIRISFCSEHSVRQAEELGQALCDSIRGLESALMG